MTLTYVLICNRCGGYLLAKADTKTRTCPYCGNTVTTLKAKRIASANTSSEASEILRRLKNEAGEKGRHPML